MTMLLGPNGGQYGSDHGLVKRFAPDDLTMVGTNLAQFCAAGIKQGVHQRLMLVGLMGIASAVRRDFMMCGCPECQAMTQNDVQAVMQGFSFK
jgi:hypothetical protein